jgi:uncharacterized protein YbjT (DUF2867 family)
MAANEDETSTLFQDNETMKDSSKETVVVAGASGLVGGSLPRLLGDRYDLVGLSRDPSRLIDSNQEPGYRWRRCDLFSRADALAALEGADRAIYLVHSMRPSARLTQGNFRDMDLICADNFARAAQHHGVKHVVYVSEIVPRREQALSESLASRLEVEQTLASQGTPLTTLRTGLVIGPGGSATELLVRMVQRLPVMGLPRWTKASVAPIAVEDLGRLIAFALEHPEWAGGSHDVGGPELVTYRDLLERTANLLGKSRVFIDLPTRGRKLATFWMSLLGGQPRAVVEPMVDSFLLDHRPTDRGFQNASGIVPIGLDEALQRALKEPEIKVRSSSTDLVVLRAQREVRSVQRLPLPAGADARWVGEEYTRWLPRFMRPFIKVERDEAGDLRFYMRPISPPVLYLEFDGDTSHPDRQLFWIRGGLLVTPNPLGRLEFREVLESKAVIAAIHQFRPRLPWLLYILTQSLAHAIVMAGFGRYLGRLGSVENDSIERRAGRE